MTGTHPVDDSSLVNILQRKKEFIGPVFTETLSISGSREELLYFIESNYFISHHVPDTLKKNINDTRNFTIKCLS